MPTSGYRKDIQACLSFMGHTIRFIGHAAVASGTLNGLTQGLYSVAAVLFICALWICFNCITT